MRLFHERAVLSFIAALFVFGATVTHSAFIPPEIVGSHMRFVEGPSVNPDGDVYVVDLQEDRGVIYKVDPWHRTTERWVETGTRGCNGAVMRPDGWLYVTHQGLRAVLRVRKINGVPEIQTVVASGPGVSLNAPNDLVFRSNGDFYFTDPIWGAGRENGEVYLRRKSGEVVRILSNVITPNGIGLSPDETTLYIAQSDLNRTIRCYLKPDGTVHPPAIFASFGNGAGPDGMFVDDDGIVYQTLYGPRRVLALAPDGTELMRWAMDWDLPPYPSGYNITNCTMAPGTNILYVTRIQGGGRLDNGVLIRMNLNTRARRWQEYR